MLAYLTLIVYANRALFFSKFDIPYWKDKYEHSQWKLPLSVRTIGDDGLYLYEGWRLIHGEDPTTMNAETPPFGKYLIGLSLVTFGNGYWFGFFATLGAVVVFYFLARTIFTSQLTALGLTLVFALDPLITYQFPLTMLDSLQLGFALLTFLVLIKLLQSPAKKNPVFLLATLGVCFGLFAGTKAPIFSPFLGLVALAAIWLKYRKLWPLVFFAFTGLIAYLLPYIPYFFLGHNLRQWLGVQKWILNFYRQSNLSPNLGSVFTALMVGRYQNIFSHAWESAGQWSLAWPLVTVLGLTGAGLGLRGAGPAKKIFLFPLSLFLLIILGFLAIIPFWTRYLLMIIPLLYLFTAGLLSRFKTKLFPLALTILAIFNLAASGKIIFPTPEGTVKQFIYDWRYGFFQDMYEQLTNQSKKPLDRRTFHRFGLTTYAGGQIEAVAIDLISPHWSQWQSPQPVKLKVTYFTRNLSIFSEDKILSVVRENGRWRIPWQWDDLIASLTPEARLVTSVDFARRGSLIGSDKKRLAEDVDSVLVWITPGETTRAREEEMLKFLESLLEGKVAAISLHQRLFGNTLADLPVPLGVIPLQVDPKLKERLLSYPGLALTGQAARVYHPNNLFSLGKLGNTQYFESCSLLYNTTAYDGAEGLEKEYNQKLKGTNGGQLLLEDTQGKVVRTILNLPKKDGEDVQL